MAEVRKMADKYDCEVNDILVPLSTFDRGDLQDLGMSDEDIEKLFRLKEGDREDEDGLSKEDV